MTGDPWRGLPTPLPIDAETFCVEAVTSSVCGWGEDFNTGAVSQIVFVTLHGGPPLLYGDRPSTDLRLVMTAEAADKLAAVLDHADHWACYERNGHNGD